MAKKATIPPDQKAALDSLAMYAGALPVRLKVYWNKGQNEGGPVQIVDTSTPSGLFEIQASALAGDGIEKFFANHQLLGATREYRVQVFMPKANGEYSATRPDRNVTLMFVDPNENAAQVAAAREAQFQATLAQANDTVASALTNAGKVLEEAAKNGTPTEKFEQDLKKLESIREDMMSQVTRFGQTPLQQVVQPAQQFVGPGWAPQPQYVQMQPQMMPQQWMPQQQAPDNKLADALVALVTAKNSAPPPATDPVLAQALAAILKKLDEKPSGPSPEMIAIQAQMTTMQAALTEAKATAAAAVAKAESDRKELELKAQIAELTRKIEGGTNKPNEALEFAKLQMTAQAQNATQVQAMMLAFQAQTDALQKEMREVLSEPGPDQSQQLRQMAGAMSEVTGTMMGMMQQVMRMGAGGGGGSDTKAPAWKDPMERVVGILANLGQGLMESAAQTTGGGAPANPTPALPPAGGGAPNLQLAGAAPAGESKVQVVHRAQKLAEGGDFHGAVAALNAAYDKWPDMIQGSRVRSVTAHLEGTAWPANTTRESLTAAYVAVFGESVKAELDAMISEMKEDVTPAANEPA